eukprot:GHVL01002416.1.p1 GENE.GHVL01002416.1~~GHVL01002416.1.p1  ORF type:complete len:528 (+),score=85.39 GHVL01002416.1:7-1590(+)
MSYDNMYDRQLRLWGSHGQKCLVESHICVLNTGPTATETLKNLVLPGLGHITLVDNKTITNEDMQNNFFVTYNDLKKNRAKVTLNWLLELNPDVKGHFIEKDPIEVIKEDSTFLDKFSLVIVTEVAFNEAYFIFKLCRKAKIIFAKTFGQFGVVRLYGHLHTVIETKPDSSVPELRISNPFPELETYIDSINFKNLNSNEQAHVPWIILLIISLKILKKEMSREEIDWVPSSDLEKEKLRECIKSMTSSPNEKNYMEAIENSYLLFHSKKIPEEAKIIFEKCDKCDNSDFWIVARGIKHFMNACGNLPLEGGLPDMTSDTNMYIKLQEIYRDRAEGDYAAVSAFVQNELTLVGQSERVIDPQYIRRVCKNIRYSRIIEYRPFQEVFEDMENMILSEIRDEDSHIFLYFAFLAADMFWQQEGRHPGEGESKGECSKETLKIQLAADNKLLTEIAHKMVDKLGLPRFSIKEEYLQAITASGGKELHVTAALIGGLVAQECVKLLTSQCAPLNNTFLWNGFTCSTSILEL